MIDGVLKPELVAPGNRMSGVGGVERVSGDATPERVVTSDGTHAYMEMSGTSMSAAVAAGRGGAGAGGAAESVAGGSQGAAPDHELTRGGSGLIEAGAGSLNASGRWGRRANESIAKAALQSGVTSPSGIF